MNRLPAACAPSGRPDLSRGRRKAYARSSASLVSSSTAALVRAAPSDAEAQRLLLGDESGGDGKIFGRPPSYLEAPALRQTVCICVMSWLLTASMMDEMSLSRLN